MRLVRLGGFRQPIGKHGEHGVTRVEIDASELIREFPGGYPVVVYKRADGECYPVASTMDGGICWFTVEENESHIVGNVEIEIDWYVGGDLAKSLTYAAKIVESVGEPSDPPDVPGENWVEQIAEMVQGVSEKVDEAVPDGGDEGQVLTKHDGANVWADPQGGGTGDHRELTNRDTDNQHPINAITGLRAELDGKQETINDLLSIREGAGKGETAVQPDDIAPVAISGSYNDLDDTPTIPESLADLEQDANHRTVTDAEKAAWSAKQPAGDYALESELAAEIEARQEAESDLQEQIDEKQDTISDLETIRSGAASGAAAYQKPSSGIPASDIADGVLPSKLSELTSDSTHRTVTDTDKDAWNGKIDASYFEHETWTFTLEDDTTVEKEVTLWIGQRA